MKYLILSDLHIGKGSYLQNGEFNILEDFFEDDRFYEFCDYFSTNEYYSKPVTIVLNGDILNLIQIDTDGVFTHVVDEHMTVRQIDDIAKGHPRFFAGLKKFLRAPHKRVVYVVGNHDAGMLFEGAQQRFKEICGNEIIFTETFIENGLHVEHGHRFEAINTVPKTKQFIKGPAGKEILNFPWGSLFCINVLPRLKKERPYIDKVRPMSSYVKWCLFNDTRFFWRLMFTCVNYVIKTYSNYYTRQNTNFKTTIKILQQITIYPKYERMARRILDRNSSIHTVVMGHTHLQEWRRFPEGRYYFNTGTWNNIPSIDAGKHQDTLSLTYCSVNVHQESSSLINASMNQWMGQWKPYIEELRTS
ncbi:MULTISPECIES: metallophosphoesterase [Halobacteriovorax]|uniref:Calcineurin-like phosphoesterase domain-containing protein n=1 Tax=Halobacteriovorax vibrionivorans TaxID=2152716 RepID=A0ABY0IE60_9BACT|nr:MULTISPECIES: metallophosphoesterase [Halobacteriovorax]RZF21235.1 hypothetical protein DAY19_06010 [Halobacteriovorax vibrionivorans]TGD48007.1 hypothetical protein EP118_06120 [Halobacteriovorax sp. Y22]